AQQLQDSSRSTVHIFVEMNKLKWTVFVETSYIMLKHATRGLNVFQFKASQGV
nr:hypothetical protein [Tanacetum cinerariifolium]